MKKILLYSFPETSKVGFNDKHLLIYTLKYLENLFLSLYKIKKKNKPLVIHSKFRGISQKSYNSLEKAEYSEEKALREAKKWVENFVNSIVDYKDYDLAKILLFKILGYNGHIYDTINDYYWAKHLIKNNHWEKIYLFHELTPKAYFLRKLGKRNKIPIKNTFSKFANPIFISLYNYFTFKHNYKKYEIPLYLTDNNNNKMTFDNSILFFGSMNTYLNPMLPVMEKLVKTENVMAIIPKAGKNWSNYSKIQKNSNLFFYEDFLDSRIKNIIYENKKKYQNLFKEKKKDIKAFSQIEGISFWNYIRKGLEFIVTDLLPHIIGYIEISEKIIKQCNPKCYIFARLRRASELALFEVCKKHKISTLMLLHGNIHAKTGLHILSAGTFANVDKICLWSEQQKEDINKMILGLPKNADISVTGNPQWDEIHKEVKNLEKKISKKEILKLISSEGKEKIITFTTQHKISNKMFPEFLRAVEKLKNHHFIIKVHPEQKKIEYQKKIPKNLLKNISVLKDEMDLHKLLLGSDIVLSYSSTTTLEALLLNTPLIILNFGKPPPNFYDFKRSGIPEVNNSDELVETLEKIFNNTNYCEEIIRNGKHIINEGFKFDGEASNRIVNYISELNKQYYFSGKQ